MSPCILRALFFLNISLVQVLLDDNQQHRTAGGASPESLETDIFLKRARCQSGPAVAFNNQPERVTTVAVGTVHPKKKLLLRRANNIQRQEWVRTEGVNTDPLHRRSLP